MAMAVVLAHSPLQASASQKQKTSKPNFVLIFTDDQGYQDVGCFGSPSIQTPNLDRMAAEGMKFTDFHVAAPVCSASRAALMTGCYPLRVGITGVLFPWHRIGLNPEEVTIADVLKAEGYATACVGKWHLGHLPAFLPISNGFDSYFGIPYSNDMDKVADKSGDLDENWKNRTFDAWNVPLMEDATVAERPANQNTLTKRYTERAVEFIKTNRDEPFFLYFPHTMPHIPLFVSDDFHVDDPQKAYKRTIEEVDWSVGEVLKALKETGVDDRTLVVFTSDNGPWLSKKHHGGSAKPLRDGKFTTWEGGMRVPCIMRFPGQIPAGTDCSKVAASIDLLPTFAALAGAQLPPGRIIDGRDIRPLMLATPGARSPHEMYYFYRGANLEAVRSGKWKYRLPRGKGKAELYDLDQNISETTNIAAQHPQMVERLQAGAEKFDTELKAHQRPVGRRPLKAKLERTIRTDLDKPESVLPTREGTVYVSNIATATEGYWEKDGKSFISILNADGAKAMASGTAEVPLHAAKGMAVVGQHLYVADITDLKRIHLKSGRIESIALEGAQRLNDICADRGIVYVSDTQQGVVYRVDPKGKTQVLPAPTMVNGVTVHRGQLYAVSMGEHDVYRLDLKGKHPPRPFGLADHFKGLDGIEVLQDGTFIVSDLRGNRVATIDSDRRTVNTLVEIDGPADIGLDHENRLYVPLLFADEVRVYSLSAE